MKVGGLLVLGSGANVIDVLRVLSDSFRLSGEGAGYLSWNDWSRRASADLTSALLACSAHPEPQLPPPPPASPRLPNHTPHTASAEASSISDCANPEASNVGRWSRLSLRYSIVSSGRELRSLLSSQAPAAVVVDPSCDSLQSAWCTQLGEALLGLARQDLVVVSAAIDAATVRGAVILARRLPYELYIRGEDDAAFCGKIATLLLDPREAWIVDGADLRLLHALPPPLVRAWAAALLAPATFTVKRIALSAGMSRRWIEKLHRRASLPNPGALLSAARRASRRKEAVTTVGEERK